MSKKLSKSQKAKKAAHSASQALEPSVSRRKFIVIPAVVAGIGVTAFGLNALESNKRQLHDISIIGNGTPSIVQLHDPTCPSCTRLKNIMQNTVGSDDRVQYRLADITTPEGQKFQSKFNLPKVTLLYFDAKGEHVHTTQGIQEPESIKENIEVLFDK